MKTQIIAIDPGNNTGIAFFEGPRLRYCTVVGKRSIAFYRLFLEQSDIEHVIMEKPVVYPYGGKGDPNHLIELALWAGEMVGCLKNLYPGITPHYIAPRAWKGTIKKSVVNARTYEGLTQSQRGLIPIGPRSKAPDHNALDAVGLGQWWIESSAK